MNLLFAADADEKPPVENGGGSNHYAVAVIEMQWNSGGPESRW